MFNRLAYFRVVAFVSIAASIFFFVGWMLLPAKLAKDSAQASVASAKYIQARTGRARFTFPDGQFAQVSCGRVVGLCDSLSNAAIPELTVWLARPAILDEPWVVAAEVQGRPILSETQQNALFSEFKPKGAVLAAIFFGVALAAFLFSRAESRPHA